MMNKKQPKGAVARRTVRAPPTPPWQRRARRGEDGSQKHEPISHANPAMRQVSARKAVIDRQRLEDRGENHVEMNKTIEKGKTMKPIFTIHAGEYLVGEYLEKHYGTKKGWRIWTPAKDTGIDLLVTSADCRKTFSIQVKFSKSFAQRFECDASGWWDLKYNAIKDSNADCWVFVLPVWPRKADEDKASNALNVDDCCFVVIEPKELSRRLEKIHPDVAEGGKYRVYLTKVGKDILETREIGPKIEEQIEVLRKKKDSPRNFSTFFNNWKALEEALKP